MILSNNPKTYIHITMCYSEYQIEIYKKYVHRWAGPSSAHTSNLRNKILKS